VPIYGLIVEGTFDSAIYSRLVARLAPPDSEVLLRDMGGVSSLMRQFPVMLRDLEQALGGHPVDRAMVLRDADGRDVAILEQAMRTRIQGQTFAFPGGVNFGVAVQTAEAWLLCDLPAINAVALARHGAEVETAEELPDDLESMMNAKQLLNRLLCRAGIPSTPQVYGEIASQVTLATLRERCPSFRVFEERLLQTI